MAAQPGQRRPAPRRRPTRFLAAAGPRRAERLLSAHRIRHRRRSPRDPGGTPAGLARRAPGVRSMSMRDATRWSKSPRRARILAAIARLLVAGALGVGAALLVSCGSSGKGLIPTGNAGPLQSDYEAVARDA